MSRCREVIPRCTAMKHIPQVGAQVVASRSIVHRSTYDATLLGPGRSSAAGLASHGRDSFSGAYRGDATHAVVIMYYGYHAIRPISPTLLLSRAGLQCRQVCKTMLGAPESPPGPPHPSAGEQVNSEVHGAGATQPAGVHGGRGPPVSPDAAPWRTRQPERENRRRRGHIRRLQRHCVSSLTRERLCCQRAVLIRRKVCVRVSSAGYPRREGHLARR